MADALTLPFPVQVDSECPPDHIWLVPRDIANRLNLWPFLSPWQQFQLERDFRKAVREKRAGLITNVNFEQGEHMDIPRTYLAEVAVASLAKVGNTEPHPLEVEQAIVDLQGVMNVIANGAAELITTPFEQAAVEALAEIPLNEWVIKWRQSVQESEVAASPQPPPDDAPQPPPDDAPPAKPTTTAKAKNK